MTIKAGETNEIYFFRFKGKERVEEGYSYNFWWDYLLPGETVIVLGEKAGRRAMREAQYTACQFQGEVLKYKPPVLFLLSLNGKPADCFTFDDLEILVKGDENRKAGDA